MFSLIFDIFENIINKYLDDTIFYFAKANSNIFISAKVVSIIINSLQK
jgi:hypothetical protein